MGRERLYSTEGIVIHRRDQGEADRVLTLCTPLGKISVIAKGARKVRSRKAGHIELFSRSHFVIARVENYWDIISQAETIDPNETLRSDLLRGTYARYATELFGRFFAEQEGGQAAFDLLAHALTRLCADDPDRVSRFYEQHILGLAGFRPELLRCVGDHEDICVLRPAESSDRHPYGFDPEHGGALCQSCYPSVKQRRGRVMALSPEALLFLQDCQRLSYRQLHDKPISRQICEETERIMQHYITYHLEGAVSAITFLRSLKQGVRLGVG